MKQVDSDGDGVGNLCDNCIRKRNPYQEDFDHDGLGNACDPDPDQDGIFTGTDNCPLARNEEQEDFDYDRVGDNCDNCPYMANTGQVSIDKCLYGEDKCYQLVSDRVIKTLIWWAMCVILT